MKVIVTSGATREHIDPVRFISNTSTGTLGALIAQAAAAAGMQVLYVHGTGAVMPPAAEAIETVPVVSAADVEQVIRTRLADRSVMAVVHPMAVADFTPRSPAAAKISSGKDRLQLELVPTAKVVNLVKTLRPDVLLVSFKLEAGIDRAELIRRAQAGRTRSKSDFVVANLAGATGIDDHAALIIGPEGVTAEVTGKARLAAAVVDLVKARRHG
jgi:phosphopantothenoylcysteine synthetase/decarboxylase